MCFFNLCNINSSCIDCLTLVSSVKWSIGYATDSIMPGRDSNWYSDQYRVHSIHISNKDKSNSNIIDTFKSGLNTLHLGVSNLSNIHGDEKRCCMSSVIKMEAMKQLN